MTKTAVIIKIQPLLVPRDIAAEMLGISVSKLEAMAAKGEAPQARQVGNRGALWLVSDLEKWAFTLPKADNLPPPAVTRRNTA